MAATRLAILFLVLIWPLAGLAAAERKVALVIGNSKYLAVEPLENPVNDANDIAAALTRLGFEVTLLRDADAQQMRDGLKTFSRTSKNAELSLLYFAGHGIEVDKTNYLLPTDVNLVRDDDVAFEAIPLKTVVRSIANSEGIKIILVDACRNNPFADRLIANESTRSIGSGLSRVDPVGGNLPGGIMISYAAREGTFALDGEGRNSPYAQGLLNHLEEPGVEVGKLFRKVRDYVFTLTEGLQEPFTYGSLPGSDIFLAKAAEHQDGANPPDSLGDALTEFYRAEWTNTPIVWREFILRFAGRDTELVALARQRLADLDANAVLRTLEKDEQPWLLPAAGLQPRGPLSLNTEEKKLVQKALTYQGFDIGAIDGQFGPQTRSIISAARLAAGLPAGFDVDANLLKRLPDVSRIDELKSKQAIMIGSAMQSTFGEPRLEKALAVLQGQRVLFDYYKGRLYIAVKSDAWGWAQSEKLARKAGGHLVTITDAQENQFVYNLVADDPTFFTERGPNNFHGPQIGLVQARNAENPTGTWVWVTGERFEYSAWGPGQPDNTGIAAGKFARFAGRRGRFNMWGDDWGAGGVFVMEIE